ncbi:MAG: hypothetical protein EOO38_21000, partial [Cytophagaceae bacterium]
MKKRTLGRSGLGVSVLTFGCWQAGGGGSWTDTNDDDSQSFVTPAPKQPSKTTSSAPQSPEFSDSDSEGDAPNVVPPLSTKAVEKVPSAVRIEDKKEGPAVKSQVIPQSVGTQRTPGTNLDKSVTKTNGQKQSSEVPSDSSTSPSISRKRAVSVTTATELRDLVKPPSAAALAKRAERARKKAAASAKSAG